jgi:long-chain acyl-CoA synthetase
MYTSGTTGRPKGVLFTHKQIAAKLHNYIRYDQGLTRTVLDARVAAYLPMAHIIGYILNLALFAGQGRIALCSPVTLFDSSPFHASKSQAGDLSLTQPEYMGAVPLMLDRILGEIHRTAEGRGPFFAALFHYLLDYKIRWRARGYDTPIINRLICTRIRRAFGGRLEIMMAGSAPLSAQTQARVGAALNVNLLQGYGSTEVTGGSHMMIPQDLGVGECGVPFHSVKYYLKTWSEGGYSPADRPNPRGEIVVGGDIVAEGYYQMEDETRETFKMDPGGVRWWESGDIGELLPNGTLRIIDRKKDLVKLSNGEFVALGKVRGGIFS